MKTAKPKAKSAADAVNAAELGHVLGISRASIANLATDRVLPRASRGMFGLAPCVQAYIRHRLLQAGAADVGTKTLVAERSRLAKFKADAAERESQVETGQLVGDLRVIDKGLSKDDRVVIGGIMRAIPGQKVDAELSSPAAKN